MKAAPLRRDDLSGDALLEQGAPATLAFHPVFPGLPLDTRPGYAAAALATSFGVGIASGLLPARRAASLDPLESLRAE